MLTYAAEEVRGLGPGANVALSGFLQSYRYFHHHRRRLLAALRLPLAAELDALRRLCSLIAPWQVCAALSYTCVRP